MKIIERGDFLEITTEVYQARNGGVYIGFGNNCIELSSDNADIIADYISNIDREKYREHYNKLNIMKNQRIEPTAGEIAVGMEFKRNETKNVVEIRNIMAQAFDMVEQSVPVDDGREITARQRKMRDCALQAILTAQMWAVKVLTLNK